MKKMKHFLYLLQQDLRLPLGNQIGILGKISGVSFLFLMLIFFFFIFMGESLFLLGKNLSIPDLFAIVFVTMLFPFFDFWIVGDPTHTQLEFIFTRAISRKAYFGSKFSSFSATLLVLILTSLISSTIHPEIRLALNNSRPDIEQYLRSFPGSYLEKKDVPYAVQTLVLPNGKTRIALWKSWLWLFCAFFGLGLWTWTSKYQLRKPWFLILVSFGYVFAGGLLADAGITQNIFFFFIKHPVEMSFIPIALAIAVFFYGQHRILKTEVF